MSTPRGPNPLLVGLSVARAQFTQRPNPTGQGTVDHTSLDEVLSRLRTEGIGSLPESRQALSAYRTMLEALDPNTLTPDESLAYWLNLYNAGALDLAARTAATSEVSVLRVPGGFRDQWATVNDEALSLDAIEHGKIRRFGDPRIHGALVCGSASCPTLRYEPYGGVHVNDQLEDQMRAFLAGGGAVADRASDTLMLSRIFLWYGADFVRPHRMPAWLPPKPRSVARALQPWLSPELEPWLQDARPAVSFQQYDWSLACSIR